MINHDILGYAKQEGIEKGLEKQARSADHCQGQVGASLKMLPLV
jgi:hypothetical protein